jgi:NAD(P)H dehydrogenase (quinone)
LTRAGKAVKKKRLDFMHIYILFAHPSRKSFTFRVLQSFCSGLDEGGHSYEIGDLYRMDFSCVMKEAQYERETDWEHPFAPLPSDVAAEQEKISRADGLAFVYPVWWSDCPAILKGWFDRVWSYGFAYFYEGGTERRSSIRLKKALALCPAGHTIKHLTETGIAQSMRLVFLDDRLLNVGIPSVHMEILGGMTNADENRRLINLNLARELGRRFFS